MSRENDAYVHCLCAVLIRAQFLKRWLILIFFSKNMQLELTKPAEPLFRDTVMTAQNVTLSNKQEGKILKWS